MVLKKQSRYTPINQKILPT